MEPGIFGTINTGSTSCSSVSSVTFELMLLLKRDDDKLESTCLERDDDVLVAGGVSDILPS